MSPPADDQGPPRNQIPSAVSAESAILGRVMVDNPQLHELMVRLQIDDFFLPLHRRIYESMQVLALKGAPIEPLSLARQMQWRGSKESEVDLQIELGRVMQDATFAKLLDYIDDVKTASIRRNALLRVSQFQDELYNDEDTAGIFTKFEQDIFDLNQSRSLREEYPSAVRRTIATIESRSVDNREILGVESGIYAVDRITEGWQPGHLIVVGGTPGTGKTAWAVNNCALFAAARRNVPVLIFTFEMLKHELIERMLAAETGIDGRRLRKGKLEAEEWDPTLKAGMFLEALPIDIVDRKLNVAQVASEIRRFRANERFFPRRTAEEEATLPPPPGLVIVDYLQLIAESGRKGTSREREVASFSETLKDAAQSTRLPVLTLAQLNREHLKRENKRPQLGDLRDSGGIEQDADIIIFLYREALYGDNPDKPATFKDDAEIIVAKNRRGDLGTVNAKFDRPTTRYYSVAERHDGD